jgi:uncharacterized membrane protein YeaQ/YmgE (transglycosylase-associated protein family)
MGIIAWIVLGTAVGLLANMLHPPAKGCHPRLVRNHDRSVGLRGAVIGVCTVWYAMASDPEGGLPLLSIHATVVSRSVPGSVRTMCSLAASRFHVEGGETRDRSCD